MTFKNSQLSHCATTTVNQCLMMDVAIVLPTQQILNKVRSKGPKKSSSGPTKSTNYKKTRFVKKCHVCGDKAYCFNFDGLCCETCKIFFRRNSQNRDKLKCLKEGSCPVNFITRKNCPKCRLEKCFKIGMRMLKNSVKREFKSECSSSDEEISLMSKSLIAEQENHESRDLSKFLEYSIRKRFIQANYQCENIAALPVPLTKHHRSQSFKLDKDYPDSLSHSTRTNNRLKTSYFDLTNYEQSLIDEVRSAMRMAFVDESSLEQGGPVTDLSVALNLPGLYVKSIVDFCQRIQAFKCYSLHDQLIVLKNFHFDLLFLRWAYFYDSTCDGYPVYADTSAKKSIFMKLDLLSASKQKNAVSLWRNLLSALNIELEGDPIMRDLFIILLLFKPQSELSCTELIKYYHCVYKQLLLKYLEHKYRNLIKANKKYATLMTLANDHWMAREILRGMLTELDSSQRSHIIAELYNLE